MEFSWEWGRGRIGAITTVGAAIAFADPAEGTITRTPATIRDIHPRADTRRITGHRSPTNLHITEDTRRIIAENRRTTVANRPTMEDTRRIMVAVNRRTMVAGRQVVEVAAVSHRAAGMAAANHPAVEEAVVAGLPAADPSS
jgi:hypothetical protein